MGVHTQFLDQWGQEISFYLGAARLARRLRDAGLPFCRPVVSAPGTDGCMVEGCYNIVLALKMAEHGREEDLSRTIVSNDLAFGPHEVTILTGPNQGGKTTYMRSVGLVHVLCQAGLPVPGRSARVSAVDSIHTHFPRSERVDLESGRFADEMRRLRDIFARATPASLILLNESLTATSARESLELAREVVGALQILGARAVYTTHLYELAAEADAFNARTTGPGRVGSLVARPGSSFKIEPGPPAGSSHAREVAARFGVSYEQLVDVLRGRRIVH
jgi:DNA mismatch repair ATPase MutS